MTNAALRTVLHSVLVLLFTSTLLVAQNPPQPSDRAKEVPPPKTADVDSPEHLLAATYDVISGPAGPRDWNRFRSLFLPEARLTAAGKRSKDGSPYLITMSVEDYIKRAGDHFAKEPFYEAPLVTKTERFGNIAQSFSSYASHHAPGDKPFERGINSFQFAFDGQRWWVVSILWDSERQDNPIPAEMDKK